MCVCVKYSAIVHGSGTVTYSSIGYISGAGHTRNTSAVRVPGVGAAKMNRLQDIGSWNISFVFKTREDIYCSF